MQLDIIEHDWNKKRDQNYNLLLKGYMAEPIVMKEAHDFDFI